MQIPFTHFSHTQVKPYDSPLDSTFLLSNARRCVESDGRRRGETALLGLPASDAPDKSAVEAVVRHHKMQYLWLISLFVAASASEGGYDAEAEMDRRVRHLRKQCNKYLDPRRPEHQALVQGHRDLRSERDSV